MAREWAGKLQVVGRAQDANGLVAVVEVDDPAFGVDDDDGIDAGIPILGDLGEDDRPAVVGGEDFEDEIRRRCGIACGRGISGHPLVGLKGDIWPTDGIRAALRDHAGIVREDTSPLSVLDGEL